MTNGLSVLQLSDVERRELVEGAEVRFVHKREHDVGLLELRARCVGA